MNTTNIQHIINFQLPEALHNQVKAYCRKTREAKKRKKTIKEGSKELIELGLSKYYKEAKYIRKNRRKEVALIKKKRDIIAQGKKTQIRIIDELYLHIKTYQVQRAFFQKILIPQATYELIAIALEK